MSDRLYVVILAGGKGERFWPLSTPDCPKPFLRFFSDRSLLQQTYDRALALVPPERIYVVAGERHAQLCREQLPVLGSSSLLLEPAGRDTAAAIGYASQNLPDDSFMLVLPADHLIPDTQAFRNAVSEGYNFLLGHDGLLTFGVKPDRPETNYGYIQVEERPLPPEGVYSVRRFIEKPDAERAAELAGDSGSYWNSGIFLWRTGLIRDSIARFLPDLWSGLRNLPAAGSSAFRQAYASLQRISIDFGVMEKAEKVWLIPAPFSWDDIGTWNSLFRMLQTDPDGNLRWGTQTSIDTADCIIYADSHTIATVGIRNLVIVQRGDRILICTREHADRLKELLAKLSE